MPIVLVALLPVLPKFRGESDRANEAPRPTNAEIMRAVFDLVLAALQPVAQERTVMDCADGKIRLCFPILSASIADHAEHAALQGIGSKPCPKCEVPCEKLGASAKTDLASDPPALRPDASAGYSASRASRAS